MNNELRIDRLKKARDYLVNEVDPKLFHMGWYRDGNFSTHKCYSTGSAIGHLTILDDKFKTDSDYFRYDEDGSIKFDKWGMYYFGLNKLEYLFLFVLILVLIFVTIRENNN